MKKLLLLAVFTLSFISCEQNETLEQELPKVLGEWQMYSDEKLESVIDQWTGTEWTYVDKWFQNIRENSEIILEFKEDGTFISRYADVTTGNGLWRKIDNNLYSFDYIVEEGNANNPDSLTNYITFYCDNTYSVSVDGDDTAIYYYKTIGATECSELITYNTTD